MRNNTPQKKFENADAALSNLLTTVEPTPASPDLAGNILAIALLDKAAPLPVSPSLAVNIFSKLGITTTNLASNVISLNNQRQTEKPAPADRNWAWSSAAGGLMAASLLLGVWTGSTDILNSYISVPLELAGIQTTTQSDEISVFEAIDGFGTEAGLL